MGHTGPQGPKGGDGPTGVQGPIGPTGSARLRSYVKFVSYNDAVQPNQAVQLTVSPSSRSNGFPNSGNTAAVMPAECGVFYVTVVVYLEDHQSEGVLSLKVNNQVIDTLVIPTNQNVIYLTEIVELLDSYTLQIFNDSDFILNFSIPMQLTLLQVE
jgi:hypothetical protein